jgi:hypothetical protein
MSWRKPRTWLRSVLHPTTVASSPPRASFLRDAATGNLSAAIESIAKEQLSLAQRFPEYLDEIREERQHASRSGARALHGETVAALKEVDSVTHQLSSRGHDATRSFELSYLSERTELLRLLSDSVCELTETIGRAGQSGPLATLTGNMAEALHAVLLTTADTMASPDEANLELLHHLTADRGQVMDGIRRALLQGEHTLTIDEHQTLFTSTSLFERIIRLLRRLESVVAEKGS